MSENGRSPYPIGANSARSADRINRLEWMKKLSIRQLLFGVSERVTLCILEI
jgi:hypothetical protein